MEEPYHISLPGTFEAHRDTYLMITPSLLGGSFPQGPLIWKQLSFPEIKTRKILENAKICYN